MKKTYLNNKLIENPKNVTIERVFRPLWNPTEEYKERIGELNKVARTIGFNVIIDDMTFFIKNENIKETEDYLCLFTEEFLKDYIE